MWIENYPSDSVYPANFTPQIGDVMDVGGEILSNGQAFAYANDVTYGYYLNINNAPQRMTDPPDQEAWMEVLSLKALFLSIR